MSTLEKFDAVELTSQLCFETIIHDFRETLRSFTNEKRLLKSPLFLPLPCLKSEVSQCQQLVRK